jgi:hypothetical protein
MRFRAMVAIVALACCTSVVALSARADWEYAKWGMTKDEVIAASKVAAETAHDRDPARIAAVPTEKILPSFAGSGGPEPDLVAFHRIAGFGFTALFYFDETGLQAVNLMLNDASEGNALYDWLMAEWGRSPASRSGPIGNSEFWQRQDDWITFALMRNGNGDPGLVSLMFWRPGSMK